MPNINRGGILEVWNRFDDQSGLNKVAGFLKAIVDTGFSWRDTLQTVVPGYRDRVVHISLSKEEGGLNLNMGMDVITTLSKRGKYAGAELTRRFSDNPPDNVVLTWDNHRWVRYRSLMAALEQLLDDLHAGYTSKNTNERGYEALLTRLEDEPPTSYKLTGMPSADPATSQRAHAIRLTEQLMALASEIPESNAKLQQDAPRPRPAIRIVPDV